jgi:hypothetical protein
MPGTPITRTGPAADYLDSQDRTPLTVDETPLPNAAVMVVLAGLLAHATTAPGDPMPSLDEAPAGWTGYQPEDVAALQRLHEHRVLTVSATSPGHALTEIDHTLTLVVRAARWDITGATPGGHDVLHRMTDLICAPDLRSTRQRAELARLVADMEVRAVARYTDALLTRDHGYPPIPDRRRSAYADLLYDGLDSGYTAGQLACLAWRAVQSSTTWCQRAPETGHEQAAGAVVTLFGRKMVQALEDRAPVPEYDIPAWAAPPAALVPGRILLHRIAAQTGEADA